MKLNHIIRRGNVWMNEWMVEMCVLWMGKRNDMGMKMAWKWKCIFRIGKSSKGKKLHSPKPAFFIQIFSFYAFSLMENGKMNKLFLMRGECEEEGNSWRDFDLIWSEVRCDVCSLLIKWLKRRWIRRDGIDNGSSDPVDSIKIQHLSALVNGWAMWGELQTENNWNDCSASGDFLGFGLRSLYAPGNFNLAEKLFIIFPFPLLSLCV